MEKSLLLVLLLWTFLIAGCGGTQTVTEKNLSQVLVEMQESSNLNESLRDLTMEDLENFYGIKSTEVIPYFGKLTDVGIISDEIVLLEASNEDIAKELEDKLVARYEAKLNEMKDYLPDEYDKILRCGVLQNGL